MSLFSSFFGEKRDTATTQIEGVLDLVTYTAGLASNPADINSLLDTVREITARLGPGQAPTAEDEKQLLGVYLELENYLTTKEPLRSFTRDELRKRIAPTLLARLPSN